MIFPVNCILISVTYCILYIVVGVETSKSDCSAGFKTIEQDISKRFLTVKS